MSSIKGLSFVRFLVVLEILFVIKYKDSKKYDSGRVVLFVREVKKCLNLDFVFKINSEEEKLFIVLEMYLNQCGIIFINEGLKYDICIDDFGVQISFGEYLVYFKFDIVEYVFVKYFVESFGENSFKLINFQFVGCVCLCLVSGCFVDFEYFEIF